MSDVVHVEVEPSSPAPRRGRWQVVLAVGYRPFFALAAGVSLLAMLAWVLAQVGWLRAPGLPGQGGAMAWHGHEMLFGFAGALIAGFLLTALRHWTGAPTATGGLLAALAGLWLAGRVAMALAEVLPRGLVVGLDLAFLPALLLVLGRTVARARAWKSLLVLVPVAALAAANAWFHAAATGWDPGGVARPLDAALLATVVLMVLVAGRILPNFTRNALGADAVLPTRVPGPAPAAAAAIVLLLALVRPGPLLEAAVAALAGGLILARSLSWSRWAAWRVPLLFVLHVGHHWLAVGFLLRAASLAWPGVHGMAATHAFGAGALGLLGLGMMVRVALGHSGRPVVAAPLHVAAFAALGLAAVVRVATPLALPALQVDGLVLAGALWCFAFAAYLAGTLRVLLTLREEDAG